MRNLSLLIMALVVISLSSCKKAYDCTCKTTKVSESYKAVMSQYEDLADDENDAIADEVNNDFEESVYSMDKTSKAEANAVCSSSESTYVEELEDDMDLDNDNDDLEVAATYTRVDKTECSLAKK